MSTRLFVGNLPENTQENDLRDAFSSFAEVVNLDLKSKSAVDSESKTFAFVSLSGSNFNIESCIKHFSNEDFNGKRLYVTRARESFLERLQRERAEAQQKSVQKEEPQESIKQHPVIKLGDKLNPRKRKLHIEPVETFESKPVHQIKSHEQVHKGFHFKNTDSVQNGDQKKQDSDKKRMEAMRKKREEFRNKQMIVKTGLTSVDKVQNKRVKFSDNEDDTPKNGPSDSKRKQANTLFDDDDVASDDDVNFEIKKQFEGKKGQKILDLQSRYKSDKRFVLDERFIEDDEGENRGNDDRIDVTQTNERAKQLNILQDVLGVAIRSKIPDDDNDRRHKQKIGMLRFDPTQPDHAKFLAPIEEVKSTKKSKKKKNQEVEKAPESEPKVEAPRPEVSKEQFYKVSDALKEAIAQPQVFSLRSLFANNETVEEEHKNEDHIPLNTQNIQNKPKLKNPLDPGERNPFVYDSSDSETEDTDLAPAGEKPAENKAVWRENLFFGPADQRLKDGLEFFNKIDTEPHKDRRELKSLMKKRIYNKDRKNQMFQKKIGGRKKTMKKTYRKKS